MRVRMTFGLKPSGIDSCRKGGIPMYQHRSAQQLRSRTCRRRTSTLPLVAALAIVAAPAGAEEQHESAGTGPRVAGRIPAARAGATRPVVVIDRDDIELSGAINVRDLVRGQLGYNRFGLYRPIVLGTARMAMLVDGRPASGSAATIDLDALPISALSYHRRCPQHRRPRAVHRHDASRFVRRGHQAGFRPGPHAVPDCQVLVRPVMPTSTACDGAAGHALPVARTPRTHAR